MGNNENSNEENEKKENLPEPIVYIDTGVGLKVVQANALITARQNLKLNSAKIIRAAIMSIKPDDTEIKPFVIKLPELAALLNIDSSNLYKQKGETGINAITDDILKNQIITTEITVDENKNQVYEKSIKLQWAKTCYYDTEEGILVLKLNDDLKPLLIGLKNRGNYNSYDICNILMFKSVYSIRLYELLTSKFMSKKTRFLVTTIELSQLRNIFNLEGKYKEWSNLEIRCIEPAVKEINEKSDIRVSYIKNKPKRAVESLEFTIERLDENPLIEAKEPVRELSDNEKTFIKNAEYQEKEKRKKDALEKFKTMSPKIRKLAIEYNFVEKYASGEINELDYIDDMYEGMRLKKMFDDAETDQQE